MAWSQCLSMDDFKMFSHQYSWNCHFHPSLKVQWNPLKIFPFLLSTSQHHGVLDTNNSHDFHTNPIPHKTMKKPNFVILSCFTHGFLFICRYDDFQKVICNKTTIFSHQNLLSSNKNIGDICFTKLSNSSIEESTTKTNLHSTQFQCHPWINIILSKSPSSNNQQEQSFIIH